MWNEVSEIARKISTTLVHRNRAVLIEVGEPILMMEVMYRQPTGNLLLNVAPRAHHAHEVVEALIGLGSLVMAHELLHVLESRVHRVPIIHSQG